MKTVYYIFVFLFGAVFLNTGTTLAATVDYQPPRLSISASNEPLLSVLRSIAKEMNISISYSANIDKTVNCRIEKLPVQRAFKNLLSNSNFVLQWKDKRVVGLTILQQGTASSQRTIIPTGHDNSELLDAPEIDPETASEIARMEQEMAAESVRMEQEMMLAQ